MTEIIEYPAWQDRARADYASGMTKAQVADKYGFAVSRAAHLLGSTWRLYAAYYKLRVKGPIEPGVIRRRIEEGYYRFVPVSGPSPAEIEKEKQSEKKAPVRRFEEVDMPKIRSFAEIKDVIEGKVIKGRMIRCSKCGATEKYSNYSGDVSDEHMPKEFSRRGWFVGNNERTDTCPSCLKSKRGPKPEQKTEEPKPVAAPLPASAVFKPKEEAKPVEAPVKSPVVEPVKHPDPLPAADRSMDRTERRLIFAKLNDVYIDETKGYSGSWSDDTVAADLGVPVVWVAEVREQDFGPNINALVVNERLQEIRQLGEKVERTIVLIDKKFDQMSSLDEKITAQVDIINNAIERFEELKKALAVEDGHMNDIMAGFQKDVDDFRRKFADFKVPELQK